MAGLNPRGDISIAILIIYTPIFFLALLLTLRHGLSRQAGWVFLLTYSIVRIVGAALHIAAEEISPFKVGIYIAAFALESAGVGPLLLCTTSFLGVVGMSAINEFYFSKPRILRLLRLCITAGFILAIIGASEVGSNSASTRSLAETLRRVGAVTLTVCFALIAIIHFIFWQSQDQILNHKKPLLRGISCAIPFLAVRVVYTLLSSFSPSATFESAGITGSNSGLAKFNAISGEWQIFLGMSLLMELVVVAIYISFGISPTYKREDEDSEEDSPEVTRVDSYKE